MGSIPETPHNGNSGGWFRLPNSAVEQIAEIGTTAFAVLAVLARHADERGECWPSVTRIAAIVGCKERAVQRSLRALQDRRLIQVKPRMNDKGQVSNLFTLPPINPVSLETPGVSKDTPGVSLGTGGPVSLGTPRTRLIPEQDPVRTRPTQERALFDAGEKVSRKRRTVGADDFAAWWAAYPRRAARATAEKAYAAAVKKLAGKRPDPQAYLLDRVQAYAAAVRDWPAGDEQFVPYPATWLNQGRFDDSPETWKRSLRNGRKQPPTGAGQVHNSAAGVDAASFFA